MIKILFRILIVLAAVLSIETIFLFSKKANDISIVESDKKEKTESLKRSHDNNKYKALQSFKKESYIKSGKNIYERIFNTQNQTIKELIQKLSTEALPKIWKFSVEVEEFSHFLLFIKIEHKDWPNRRTIAKKLYPIILHGYPYLKSIAVVDESTRNRWFFDTLELEKIKSTKNFNAFSIGNVINNGNVFFSHNTVNIPMEKQGRHFYIYAIITDNKTSRSSTSLMLFDTGASRSILSNRTAVNSGSILTTGKEYFQTANGRILCPIMQRTIKIGNIERSLPVAVNVKDSTDILGMDFLEGKDYLIDGKRNCIYIWNI